jgi:hypothetical protein
MPPRGKIARLPAEIKAELDKKLINNAFSDCQGLADWLSSIGYEIKKSAIGAYSKEFKERLEFLRNATEQARAIATEAGDDDNSLGDALTRLVQHKIFQILVDLEINSSMSLDDLEKLSRSISSLNRMAILQKRWMLEARERAKTAADEIETITRQAGLSDDTAALIRAKVMGVAG